MDSLIVNIIGYTAAVVGTTIILPQVVKSIKTKSVDDISFWMLIIYMINCSLWVIYGILIIKYPVILSNAIAFSFVLIQLFLKIKYTKKNL